MKKTPIIKAKPLKLDYNTRLKKKYGRSVNYNFNLVAKYRLQTILKIESAILIFAKSSHVQPSICKRTDRYLFWSSPFSVPKRKLICSQSKDLLDGHSGWQKAILFSALKKGRTSSKTLCQNQFPAAVSQCTLATPETL